MAGALDGILVADFTRVIAGPQCTMTLADFGAEVIKIEHPEGGDDTRGYRPPEIDGEATFFFAYNRNKRSIALDLSKPEARAVARRLVDMADVLVENFSTGVMGRFGLDYGSVKDANPRLIYCSISGYGRDGAVASRAGYDPVVQAESGLMSVNGFPDREPVRSGVPVVDITTGMTACQAVLAALFHRERTGNGQYLEVALFDAGVALTVHYGIGYLATGVNPGRAGNGSPAAEPIGVFQAKDGIFQMTMAGERVWRKLCNDVIKRPDLIENPAFANNTARIENKLRLHQILNEIFATDTRDAWVEKLRAGGAPGGPVRSIAEAMDSQEVKERGLVSRIPHGKLGTIPNINCPIRFATTPVRTPVGAPTLGEHTEQVLRGLLGLSPDEIQRLKAAKAIP
ncbi:MAG: CoA transferase [Alphaproteobacteria bacterium]|nr:CoA transferase [Alphaproteobacteria bacterium]